MPERIQLRRTKGWRKPEGVIVVSRPSRWGNPFAARIPQGEALQAADVRGLLVAQFRDWLAGSTLEQAVEAHPLCYPNGRRLIANIYPRPRRPTQREIRDALSGHDLACWCPLDSPCHADVLLEIANTTTNEG
ncbi:DUF4326 domain-containing protein [Mycobacteroides abscessus]|nr:DUF4326 domain-containing protein [Mycobacteroides abscessus]MDM2408473.1 DUF4326 domain-containing protein [Mycobacteroides abscessus]